MLIIRNLKTYMTYRAALVIALLTLTGLTHSLAQKLDSAALADIGKQLVDMELAEGEGKHTHGDNCLHDADGNFLSCFTTQSGPDWVADFNGDGH
ncbi:MAG: hypothetical protein EOP49_17320, partial [Sphingobacteriales bacterium]